MTLIPWKGIFRTGGGVADASAILALESLDEWMFKEYWQLGDREPIGDGANAGCVLWMLLYGAPLIKCGYAFPERKHVMERLNRSAIAFNVHFQRGEKRHRYGGAACGMGDSNFSFRAALHAANMRLLAFHECEAAFGQDMEFALVRAIEKAAHVVPDL